MTNILFNRPREYMVNGQFTWIASDIIMLGWTGIYKFDETHRLVQEIIGTGASIIAQALPILNKSTYTGGYVQSGPVVFPNVPVGPPIVFVTLSYNALPVESGELIAYYDTGEGLPYTPNGLDVTIQPDWLQNRGWFRP